MTHSLFLFHFLLLIFHVFFSFIPALSLSSDGLALLALKSAVDQPSSAFSDWNDGDVTPCAWSGIVCANISGEEDPRVVGIALAGKSISGYLPSELGSLRFLRRLNLHDNAFSGVLPAQLSNATALHSLFLHRNNLSGPIPRSLCSLPRLQNLDLSENAFSGHIPDHLGNCKNLQRLIVAGNRFSGEIPAGVWPELQNLLQLDLSANELTGSIPDEIGTLVSLSGTLNLSFNHLSGKIPASLGKLPATVSFDFRNNNLSGEIPQTGSFSNQGPTAFLGNPNLCGFPLRKSCSGSDRDFSPGSDQNKPVHPSKGLSPGLIILISAADAAVVAFIGLVIVYVYWKKKDDENACSCIRRRKFGEEKGNVCFCGGFPCVSGEKSDDDEKLLISDFISNGNLTHALRGRNGQPSTNLSWSTRLKIAKGTARGLAYLHECSPRKFVHGDIKPSNILLDNDFQPYISDFGLNRLISITGNNPSTGGFMGGALPYMKSSQKERTDNYKAPEARVPGCRPTQKWDVYSFGVVLLEILTGRSPESSPTTSTSMEVPDLVRWVRKGFDQESPLSEMVDPSLLQEVRVKKEVLAVFHVALACTEGDPEARPRMKTVSENLDKIGT